MRKERESIGPDGGTPTTTVSNGGLWLITSDNNMAYGGGATPMWTNSGTRPSGSAWGQGS